MTRTGVSEYHNIWSFLRCFCFQPVEGAFLSCKPTGAAGEVVSGEQGLLQDETKGKGSQIRAIPPPGLSPQLRIKEERSLRIFSMKKT